MSRAREEVLRRPREICIVMLSALGDAVHVLPVVNALRRAHPEARITWLIQPLAHRLVEGHPALDEFILFRRRRGIAAWRSFVEARRALRGRRFDLVLALQVYFKAGVLTALADARVKLGFDRARARDLNWLFTDERIAPHPVQHVQDQYFEFVEHLGIDPRPVEWGIPMTGAEREAQREFFGRVGGRTCAIVVGTSKLEKNWAPERYGALLDRMREEHGLTPLLVGGPSPIEREMADAILRTTTSRPIDLLGDDLRRLVWLLDGADLVVSPDTGPLHIARALDTPVVGLYGYTNPKRYGPYRKYEDLVADGYAAYPGEDYPASMEYRREGMGRVSVDMAAEKVALAVERYVWG